MIEESYNEKTLIRYLLGNLPEEQMLQIEGKFLSDDQSYERLLALENELLYDYAQNKLSAEEREQFEKRFLSFEPDRRRAEIASALLHKMFEAAPVETTEKEIADRESQHFWRHLKSYFFAQSAAMRVSLAGFAIVSLALIWLVIGIFRLRNEFNQFMAQRAVQEDQLRRLAQQESARADELNLKLRHKIDENATLQQELSETQPQSGGQGVSSPSVISLVLSPAVVRYGTGMKKLYLPPRARLLKLRLNLKWKVEYKAYQVTLLTVEGAELWSRDNVPAQRTGSSRSIDLWLPTGTLADGDYELRLNGYASDGTTEEARDYYNLSIRRK